MAKKLKYDNSDEVVVKYAIKDSHGHDIDVNSKQDTLVSGTNIKTVNGNTLLGSGNIEVDGLPSSTGLSDGDYVLQRAIASGASSDSWATNGMFNVIKASDITNNILTQEQYDLITNGKPTLIEGTFSGHSGFLLSPALHTNESLDIPCVSTRPEYYNYASYGIFHIEITNKRVTIGGYITMGGGHVSLSNVNISNLKNLNYKTFPAYPTSPTINKFLTYKTDNTLAWTDVSNKQDTLVSGTNIKTINNQSILGSGNISISAPTYTAGNGIDITGSTISVDTEVIATKTDLTSKQDTLTEGNGIDITDNTISVDTTIIATKNDLTSKENVANKVTSMSASSTDTQYPSAKCVYDAIADLLTMDIVTSEDYPIQ